MDKFCKLLKGMREDEAKAKGEYQALIDAASSEVSETEGKDDIVETLKGIQSQEVDHHDFIESLYGAFCQ